MRYTKPHETSAVFPRREWFDEFEAVRLEDGSWRDAASGELLPGARDITAAEFLRPNARFTFKMGDWVSIAGDVAQEQPEILKWCWKHANSGSPSLGFRFARRSFEQAGKETFPIAFVPEVHDRRPEIRELAQTERELRKARKMVASLEQQRAERLRAAAGAGFSRRKLGELVGLSFARVHQLVSAQAISQT